MLETAEVLKITINQIKNLDTVSKMMIKGLNEERKSNYALRYTVNKIPKIIWIDPIKLKHQLNTSQACITNQPK